MPSDTSPSRSALAERLLFLRAFLAHPRQMGAMLPTSRAAVEAMLDLAAVEEADLVLELGAGTGSHTRAILERMGPQGHLVAVEIDPALADTVRATLEDPRLEVVTGSAEDLHEILAGRAPDVVVSALPFTSLPAEVSRQILDRATQALAAGGVLLVLQYSPLIGKALRGRFARVHRTVCLRNLPPAWLFACRDPQPARGRDGPASPGPDAPA